jgi:hypothetical protein
MKKKLFVLVLVIGALIFFNIYAISAEDEIGTYALFKVKEHDKEILYKINTKNGKVWCYDEFRILKAEDLGLTGKEAEGLNKLISQENKKKMGVYTLPCWMPTSEKPSGSYVFTKPIK